MEIVVGVLEKGKGARQELVDEALKLGHGTLFALDNRKKLTIHSTERACPKCNRSFEPLDPKNFSYNSAQGWCPRCRGFGELFYLPEVERGANADSIEESWSWAQERKFVPSAMGTVESARAVRLKAGAANGPTIDAFATLDVEATSEFVRKMKFTGRAAEIARDILLRFASV